MHKIRKTVFISYRRTNIAWALAIYQNLTFRGYDVFFDYESIKVGDFEQIILRSIESRAHFVVILTPSALERCAEPEDWLRREIEHAIKHKRNIIPLTLENFDFKDMKRYLPRHIAKPLSRYNGLRVPMDYFSEAMDRLCERLDTPLNAVLHPPSRQLRAIESRQKKVAGQKPHVDKRQLTATSHFEQAYHADRQGRQDHAMENYSEAICLNPQLADAYNNRAAVHYQQGDYLHAIEDYNNALRINPAFTLALIGRGSTYGNLGEYDLAIKDFDQALRINPQLVDALAGRGLAYYSKGDFETAIADYNMALAIDPSHTFARKNREVAMTYKQKVSTGVFRKLFSGRR